MPRTPYLSLGLVLLWVLASGCLVSLDESLWQRADTADGAAADQQPTPAPDAETPGAEPDTGVDDTGVDDTGVADDGGATVVDPCASVTCAPHQVCIAGRCQTTCINPCGAGDRQCVGDAVRTCQAQPSGCLGWGTPEDCPDQQVCSGGACAAACVDQCTAGEVRCSGTGARQTCTVMPSGCTDWGQPVTCPTDEVCSAGTCGPALCSAAGVATSCDPVDLDGCDDGDCYLTPKGTRCVCPAGTVASGGACNGTAECAPGHVCAGSKAPGTCRPICRPSAPQCPKNWGCVPINSAPTYGLCRPHS